MVLGVRLKKPKDIGWPAEADGSRKAIIITNNPNANRPIKRSVYFHFGIRYSYLARHLLPALRMELGTGRSNYIKFS